MKPAAFLTKYWDTEFQEKIISSENYCTDGLDHRACQHYFLVTNSDYRKGAIFWGGSRVENAQKKKTGV